mmetsp:Transcript_18881/g.41585  ORF Transcript_18881/g.41585 Transcript_18881/m.41585 type:complete len:210 (-) Transcript_18881:246-875(-)
MKLTSPGTVLGASSASPEKRIFCPFLMPFSTFTSSTFRSLKTFFPLQLLHFSFSSIILQAPRQLGQATCICCIIPGPNCRSMILAPRPLHSAQSLSQPSAPPRPSQSSHNLSRLIANLTVFPLYRSSRVTLMGWLMSSPFCGPDGPRPRRPPPKNMENMSSAECPSPPPCPSKPSLPYLSYIFRFSGSQRTSAALLISLKTSTSPPLSG